jgi:hypothetical protein
MHNLTLNQLITISPLNQGIKEKLTASLSTLSPRQKFDLTKSLWRSITLTYKSLTKEKIESMLDEMAHAKATYEKADFQNAENEIFNKLLVKIDETQSSEEAESLKQQLKNPDSPPPVN